MNYAAIKNNDIANGPGIRVSLFVSGCRHRCKGCFNSEAWNFDYGKPFTDTVADEIIANLSPGYINGLSLLGGEPFEPENAPCLLNFVRRVRRELPEKTIWCYTGFSFENEILAGKTGNHAATYELLTLMDVLVDGRFLEELKDISLIFRGSSNQNIIDLPASLKQGKTVLLPGTWKRTVGSGNIYDE